MRRFILLLAVCLPLLPASADFVPGRLYISVAPLEGFPDQPNRRVYEFDPQTGQSRVFAEMPDAIEARLSGLCFSPDGSTLYASLFQTSTIAAISPDGGVTTAYGPAQGIAGPLGANNLDFDDQGRFYVANYFNGSILRFPTGGGTPDVLLSSADVEPITVTRSGQVYYASDGSTGLRRISADGIPETFDTLPGLITSLTSSSAGDLFVSAHESIYMYTNEDPSSRVLLTSSLFESAEQAIALSPDESTLYVTDRSRVYSVSVADGATTQIGAIIPGYPALPGDGLAVYIPEPTSLAALLIFLFVGVSRIRR